MNLESDRPQRVFIGFVDHAEPRVFETEEAAASWLRSSTLVARLFSADVILRTEFEVFVPPPALRPKAKVDPGMEKLLQEEEAIEEQFRMRDFPHAFVPGPLTRILCEVCGLPSGAPVHRQSQ